MATVHTDLQGQLTVRIGDATPDQVAKLVDELQHLGAAFTLASGGSKQYVLTVKYSGLANSVVTDLSEIIGYLEALRGA